MASFLLLHMRRGHSFLCFHRAVFYSTVHNSRYSASNFGPKTIISFYSYQQIVLRMILVFENVFKSCSTARKHWLFHAEKDPKWCDRQLMKQHGGNLGKCACVGNALCTLRFEYTWVIEFDQTCWMESWLGDCSCGTCFLWTCRLGHLPLPSFLFVSCNIWAKIYSLSTVTWSAFQLHYILSKDLLIKGRRLLEGFLVRDVVRMTTRTQ
jgi:hypothetical protein